MPATEVNPALRRRLSDDARQLLRSALGHKDPKASAHAEVRTLGELPLAQRLQHFRGQVRLDLPSAGNSLRLRIVVSDTTYLLRYHLERIGAEVSVFSKAGAMTTWITTSDGRHLQLRRYLSMGSTSEDEIKEITTLTDILEVLDLFDVFRACLDATEVPGSMIPGSDDLSQRRELYAASTERSSYVFVVDGDTGKPVAITQTPAVGPPQPLHMIIEEYLRYEGPIDVPEGIKSDVELMIDTAMTCFGQWSLAGQQRVMEIFDVVDKDDDGCISGQDVYAQLLGVGHSEHQCANIVMEMSRLLCDTSDPSEEFGFYKFCGFWVTMLADSYLVSDPSNESTVLVSFEKLFLGL